MIMAITRMRNSRCQLLWLFFALLLNTSFGFVPGGGFIGRQRARCAVNAECTKGDGPISILREAAYTRKVGKEDVISALEQLNMKRFATKVSKQSISGKWELVFSSLIGSGYFPVKELCDFYGFTLTSSWGPITLGEFKGSSRIVSEKPLVVEFENEEYALGPLSFKVPSKTRNYRFMYVDDKFAVATSSNGGFTLLKREI